MSRRLTAALVELANRVITKASAPVWIVSGLFIWALVLAIGAYRYNHHWGRAAVVFGCTAVFVVFWAAMLGVRRKRLETEATEDHESELP